MLRTRRPSVLMRASRADVRFCGRSDRALGRMIVRNAGSSVLSCAPVAAPRAPSAASTRPSRSANQRPTSPSMAGSLPLRSSRLVNRRRSIAASGVLTAAWTTGMSGRGKTNSVRRIAIHRTRPLRSYIAAETSVSVGRSAAGEHGEVDRCRVRCVQRDQRVRHRFRTPRVTAEVVSTHDRTPPLLHRDPAQCPALPRVGEHDGSPTSKACPEPHRTPAFSSPGGNGCVWPAANATPRWAPTRGTRRRRRSARRTRAGLVRCRA